ncbi:MAG TPA: hypothetical protein VMV46_13150 [Thermoanaerobaculia bacterium]|nr:hypothetical protein [Thermoanaerobaculia bacterium]
MKRPWSSETTLTRRARRRRRPATAVLVAGLALSLGGCGTRAALEECQARLTATEAERARLDKDLGDLRGDYKEVLRSFAVTPAGEGVTADLRTDVQEQIEVVKSSVADQVPPLVREQLERELESLLTTLDRQFGEIDVQYSRISTQLREVRGSLDVANERLEGIEVSGEGLRREIGEQRIDQTRLEQEVERVATSIEDFDESYFLCRDCEEHLDIRRKRLDPILAFHADVKSALRRLPTRIAGVEAGFEDGDGEEEAGGGGGEEDAVEEGADAAEGVGSPGQ